MDRKTKDRASLIDMDTLLMYSPTGGDGSAIKAPYIHALVDICQLAAPIHFYELLTYTACSHVS